MLSLIEVKCPHCGAEGQINLPPLGAIIVGPCPECGDMVVIYCGKVMPLDKEIMKNGGMDERRAHLKEVLRTYIEERVDRLFDNFAKNAQTLEPAGPAMENAKPAREEGVSVISEADFEKFRRFELRLIDDYDYFQSIFG